MAYYNKIKQVKDSECNKTIAVATYEVGAEIIVKALNYYFGDTYTRNQSVEMMNTNTADALKRIADLAVKHEMSRAELIIYLRELSEEMAAQALVVSLRDELKFDKPKSSTKLE